MMRVEAVGTATAEAYEKQKKAIGPQAIMAIELAKHISAGKIKIMPEILTIGSGGAPALGIKHFGLTSSAHF